ncbi:hypothetical protein [Pseudogemmobacter blasticus]|uniref:Uncharacterized protein n=1 Tax=Fuscovulum blasticum DSM 2131 TaxID=1188250 RepID=A0A2T4JDK3_FUSBL|nr:hypothetical protein [Fuscovulum blasticum]PTE15994.1 hypothetical protein C5F44_02855 [Fuscovulum blasticum DSM 2131]
MSALLNHIQAQQDTACKLANVLHAASLLDDVQIAPDAVSRLIGEALTLARNISINLDCVSLPEGAA